MRSRERDMNNSVSVWLEIGAVDFDLMGVIRPTHCREARHLVQPEPAFSPDRMELCNFQKLPRFDDRNGALLSWINLFGLLQTSLRRSP